jgi:hypothetical protein
LVRSKAMSSAIHLEQYLVIHSALQLDSCLLKAGN